MHKGIKPFIFFATIIALMGCESSRDKQDFETAKAQLQKQKTLDGLITIEKMMKVYPESPYTLKAALEAENVCLKDKSCIDYEEVFLRYIVEKSKNEEEEIHAQKRLCEILYDKGFYKQAIEEMSRLLSKEDFKNDREEMRLKLARSNFYIRNFYQAQTELNAYLKKVKTDEEQFEGYLLQADIQAADKKYSDAMQTYKYIQDHFKDLYFKNQVYMNEVLLLEEQKQLDQAISILESVKTQAGVIDVIQTKIDRLKQRRALLPGATGLKK